MATYTFSTYSPVVERKIRLVKKFKDFLEGNKDNSYDDQESNESVRGVVPEHAIYVKQWLRTKHAVVFRLNTKVIQACFKDNTELILCVDSKLVTYYDKNKNPETYSMTAAEQSKNEDMTKRLRYTKDILSKFIALKNKP